MHLGNRPPHLSVSESQLRTGSFPVFSRPFNSHPQSGKAAFVPVKLRAVCILCHNQIHSPVAIKIGNSAASLFSVNFDPALLTGYDLKFTETLSSQEQSSSRVHSAVIFPNGKKVLREEQINM